jgi:Spy/CpxP family protein refolding chaperone
MKTIMGLGNTLLLALNLSTLGTLAYKGRIWEQRPEEALSAESIEETLELTPSQMRAIEVERESFVNEWDRIETELQSSREMLVRAVREGETDPSVLGPVINRISQLQAELETRAVNQLYQEQEVLTPDQRERYFSQIEGQIRQGRGRMRRGRGLGSGGQGGSMQPGLGQTEQGQQPELGQPGRGKKGRGKGRWRK